MAHLLTCLFPATGTEWHSLDEHRTPLLARGDHHCMDLQFWYPSRAQPSPTRETELVPVIKDTGFPTPLAVRIGATSYINTTSWPSVLHCVRNDADAGLPLRGMVCLHCSSTQMTPRQTCQVMIPPGVPLGTTFRAACKPLPTLPFAMQLQLCARSVTHTK